MELKKKLWEIGKYAHKYPEDWIVVPILDVIELIDEHYKEFIKELKADLKLNISTNPLMDRIIDKLAGDKLLEEAEKNDKSFINRR